MELISQEWTQSHCAVLPLEVWERIVAHIDEPHYHPRAWLNLRRVSRALKAATEHVFATKHLPESRIELPPLVLRNAFSTVREAEVVEISLAFDRLSDDGSRAMFVSKNTFEIEKKRKMSAYGTPATGTVYENLMRKWKSLTRASRQSCPSVENLIPPGHCFVIYGDANDTELSGVQFEVDNLAASVLWKPMLSLFYGEIEYVKWADKVIRQHAARSEEGLVSKALQLGMAFKSVDDRLFLEDLRLVMVMAKRQEEKRTRTIRIMRYKRMLGKMRYREVGEDPERFFEMTAHSRFVEDVRDSLTGRSRFVEDVAAWYRDEYEASRAERERGAGCFYDGLGMKFDGKRELNSPGEFSDDEDEWEDVGDSDEELEH